MKSVVLISVPILAIAVCASGQVSYTICQGDSIQLSTSGGNLYEWQPHTGLSNPYSATPWARPNSSTLYTVLQLQTSGNLIQNGDFNQGSAGFTSQYHDSTSVIKEGYYSITSNPRNAHFAFRTCSDHTSGTGNMMVINGASVPNQQVWIQTINILPNTNYAFSAYINAGISSGDKCILQFSINGQLLDAAFTIRNIRCEWQRFYAIWYSDTATSANIAIVNQNTERQGNDFALDDILFEQYTTTTDSVLVHVNPSPDTPGIRPSGQDSLVCTTMAAEYEWKLNGHPTSGRLRKIKCSEFGFYTVETTAADGCTSAESNPYSYQVTAAPKLVYNRSVAVVPNPACSTFQIQGVESHKLKISVVNSLGKLILDALIQPEIPIDVSSWAPGIYLVKLQDQDEVGNLKLQVLR